MTPKEIVINNKGQIKNIKDTFFNDPDLKFPNENISKIEFKISSDEGLDGFDSIECFIYFTKDNYLSVLVNKEKTTNISSLNTFSTDIEIYKYFDNVQGTVNAKLKVALLEMVKQFASQIQVKKQITIYEFKLK